MPDDVTVDEVAEQPDVDAEEGFALGLEDAVEAVDNANDTDDTGGADDDKPVEPAEEKTDDADGTGEVETADEATAPDEEKEITAEDKINQRIKEFEAPADKKEPESVEATPPPMQAPSSENEDLPSSVLTKEQIEKHLNAFSDDNLPEGNVFIGDTEIDLREFAAADPEQFAAVKILSSVIAQKAINEALQKNVPNAEIQNQLDEQRSIIDSFVWWEAVTNKHADGKTIKDSPEFSKWFDAQPDNIKRFGYADASPEDAILVLDFYKEDIAKENVKKHDDLAKDKKKRTDDLHKDTMRVKNDTNIQSNTANMDDAEAGFNEGLKAGL